MQIGTDVSIAECRFSGYPVLKFKERELFPNGRAAGLDKNCKVLLTISNPERWRHNGTPKLPTDTDNLFSYRGMISWNDVYEAYLSDKTAIDNYADMENCPIDMDNPSEHEFVTLAGIVYYWQGAF